MKVTNALVSVVACFAAAPDEDHWGYKLTDSTGVLPGALYPLLKRLLADGWIEDRWEDAAKARSDGRPPRRLYRVTQLGLTSMGVVLGTARNDRRFTSPAIAFGGVQ